MHVSSDNFNLIVSLNLKDNHVDTEDVETPQITLENWHNIFAQKLAIYKESGFARINPSILKADIISEYPDFNERVIGFKRFSDVMKQLEKEGLVKVELDEQKTMLIHMI